MPVARKHSERGHPATSPCAAMRHRDRRNAKSPAIPGSRWAVEKSRDSPSRSRDLGTMSPDALSTDRGRITTASMPQQDTSTILFESIMREQADMLHTFIRVLVADDQSREEVFHETVVVAWKRLSSYDPERPIGHWLRGIARKVALAHLRGTGRHLSLDENLLDEIDRRFGVLSGQPGDTFEEKLDCLRSCLGRLDDRERTALRTRYEDGLRGSPLAERIGTSLEAAKKIVQRARARLRGCMEARLAWGEAR